VWASCLSIIGGSDGPRGDYLSSHPEETHERRGRPERHHLHNPNLVETQNRHYHRNISTAGMMRSDLEDRPTAVPVPYQVFHVEVLHCCPELGPFRVEQSSLSTYAYIRCFVITSLYFEL
jgi:hypothetical protein